MSSQTHVVQAASSRVRYLAPLAVVFLLGAKEGTGCSCRRGPDEDTSAQDTDVGVSDVSNQLQVVSIDPATGHAGTSFQVRVYGSGFVSGASLAFGDRTGEKNQLVDEHTLEAWVPSMAKGTYDVVVTNPDGATATLRRGLTITDSTLDCSFLRVYFDFDEAGLTAPASAALDDLMPCYTQRSGRVTVEGHADERGTTEYNLALGQRRADSVARYLSGGGVAGSRVDTKSYGEERPVKRGHDEAAWAENRRVDLYAD